MFIGNKHQYNKYLRLNFDIVLNDETVENVQNIKYLGLLIDIELKFHKHMQFIAKKGNKSDV